MRFRHGRVQLVRPPRSLIRRIDAFVNTGPFIGGQDLANGRARKALHDAQCDLVSKLRLASTNGGGQHSPCRDAADTKPLESETPVDWLRDNVHTYTLGNLTTAFRDVRINLPSNSTCFRVTLRSRSAEYSSNEARESTSPSSWQAMCTTRKEDAVVNLRLHLPHLLSMQLAGNRVKLKCIISLTGATTSRVLLDSRSDNSASDLSMTDEMKSMSKTALAIISRRLQEMQFTSIQSAGQTLARALLQEIRFRSPDMTLRHSQVSLVPLLDGEAPLKRVLTTAGWIPPLKHLPLAELGDRSQLVYTATEHERNAGDSMNHTDEMPLYPVYPESSSHAGLTLVLKDFQIDYWSDGIHGIRTVEGKQTIPLSSSGKDLRNRTGLESLYWNFRWDWRPLSEDQFPHSLLRRFRRNMLQTDCKGFDYAYAMIQRLKSTLPSDPRTHLGTITPISLGSHRSFRIAYVSADNVHKPLESPAIPPVRLCVSSITKNFRAPQLEHWNGPAAELVRCRISMHTRDFVAKSISSSVPSRILEVTYRSFDRTLAPLMGDCSYADLNALVDKALQKIVSTPCDFSNVADVSAVGLKVEMCLHGERSKVILLASQTKEISIPKGEMGSMSSSHDQPLKPVSLGSSDSNSMPRSSPAEAPSVGDNSAGCGERTPDVENMATAELETPDASLRIVDSDGNQLAATCHLKECTRGRDRGMFMSTCATLYRSNLIEKKIEMSRAGYWIRSQRKIAFDAVFPSPQEIIRTIETEIVRAPGSGFASLKSAYDAVARAIPATADCQMSIKLQGLPCQLTIYPDNYRISLSWLHLQSFERDTEGCPRYHVMFRVGMEADWPESSQNDRRVGDTCSQLFNDVKGLIRQMYGYRMSHGWQFDASKTASDLLDGLRLQGYDIRHLSIEISLKQGYANRNSLWGEATVDRAVPRRKFGDEKDENEEAFRDAVSDEVAGGQTTLQEPDVGGNDNDQAANDETATGQTVDASSPGSHPTPVKLKKGVWIALGSNVGDRLQTVETACRRIDEDENMRIVQTSSLYETKPMYVEDQDPFLNGVCEIETSLRPMELLDRLQAIEQDLGRVKLIDKGPRNIDLDILLYGDEKIKTERLTVPHPLMLEREFVLRPLCDTFMSDTRIVGATNATYHSHLKTVKSDPSMFAVTPLTPEGILRQTRKRRTLIMSILNMTPDSFSDGGVNQAEDLESLHTTILAQIAAGADIIDIGGQSSRPNAPDITAAEEIARVLPAIALIKSMPQADYIAISIDTYRASVAKAAVEAGAHIVNDISAGLLDDDMFSTVAHLECTYIMSHMRGTPATMQDAKHTAYPRGVLLDIAGELQGRVAAAMGAGIRRWRIILDPGIGFAKTSQQNLEILTGLGLLRRITRHQLMGSLPFLIGTSRKGFIGQITGVKEPSERVMGTAATVAEAVRGGADIVRVHDVAEMAQVVKMAEAMYRG